MLSKAPLLYTTMLQIRLHCISYDGQDYVMEGALRDEEADGCMETALIFRRAAG